MSEAKQQQQGVIACDLTVFTPEEREHHFAVCDRLFGAVSELRDLPDGCAFRLSGEPSMLALVFDFIANERRCCPFETFAVEVEPYGAAIWLRLTGPEGYREMLLPDLLKVLNAEVASAAGLS